ncbi:coiled-coil domain-containing protein [Actinoplanes sp. NPDC051859]|uniref:coiled-coil domain-containing protein n=1 Tax=Actinoplanes sp. NPDC051859 TaxID=3363909 RepID=UPI0037B89E90
MAATFLRRAKPVLALLAAIFVLLAAPPAAHADPDEEGASKKLRTALESAVKGHVEAKQKLAASKKRQGQLKTTLAQAKGQSAQLTGRVGEIANRSYRQGRLGAMTMLLNTGSSDEFMDRMIRLDQMAQVDSHTLAGYRDALTTAEKAGTAIELEIKEQQKQVTVMAKQKEQAETALIASGGGTLTSGFGNGKSPKAKAAPRNGNGELPGESCSADDPTTTGCITPRLLNALQQSRAIGFKRHTSCFAQRASGGEHPQGKACDFSAAPGGFENVDASGDDRTYGNNLAAYLVDNADRLGVMYVIWYREIWLPGSGWRSYSGSGGPAAAHTNHVHLSIL